MVSYGTLIIVILILSGGALYSFIFPTMVNSTSPVYETFITSGQVSQQNLTLVNFITNVIKYAFILVTMIGVFAWGIIRAIEKKNEG